MQMIHEIICDLIYSIIHSLSNLYQQIDPISLCLDY